MSEKLARMYETLLKTSEENDGYKALKFYMAKPNLSAMLSFSIRERTLSGIMTMKFGSTSDQLVATNLTGS